MHVVQCEDDDPGGGSDARSPPQGAAPRELCVPRGASAERLADEGLCGDFERVECEREQRPDLHRDLLRGELDLAESGGRCREDEERAAQEQGAQEEEPSIAPRRSDRVAIRTQGGAL